MARQIVTMQRGNWISGLDKAYEGICIMKIILSRKGFDSGYGGYPSPILPDGRLLSFPIPDLNSPIKYSDLYLSQNKNFTELISELIGSEIKFEGDGKKLIHEVGCHLDPDIDSTVCERSKDWRALFGQAGAAHGHLSNQNVSVNDIFLFFGWFRQVELIDGKYKYSKTDRKGKHVIYGYMQIGEIKKINSSTFDDWMLYHPHIVRGTNATDTDHIYIANETLTFDSSMPGFGTFNYNDDVQLTKEGLSKSKWNLPEIFKNTSISYHTPNSWKDGYFQSAAKGQEFVINSTPEIEDWMISLLQNSVRNR